MQLGTLHSTLADLHAHAAAATAAHFPGPAIANAKHQLRDWIETQLGDLREVEHLQAFSDRLNEKLTSVDIAVVPDAAGNENLLGTLGSVRIRSESGLLIVMAAVGVIECQFDESVYGYKRVNDHWQRIWESQQDDYSPKTYAPQDIFTVRVWQSYKDGREDGPAFVMTLGNHWGCVSAWHPVYYRVWRVDSSGFKLLIEGSEIAWLRADAYAVGSIGQDSRNANAPVDVLIEFTEQSVDPGVHNREAIRHFLIEGDRVRRVDPVALSPRDFVDEWLTHGWKESARWSASSALQKWNRALRADDVAVEFGGTTMHCSSPDLWQVVVEPKNAGKNFEPEPNVYFLVRWRPPYHFTMTNIGNKPWPRCSEEDPDADVWRTLFSEQGWRQ